MTASPNGQFAGEVAVITGGSQGLGEATARMMASRGAAGLVLVGRNAERGQAVADSIASGTWSPESATPDGDSSPPPSCEAIFVSADLAAADAADRIMAAADQTFGRVDHLVNAAGLTVRGSVWDTGADLWSEMFNVNSRAPAMLISAAAKIMKREAIEGTVVNIGSVAAYGGQDFLYPYSASKAALQAITRNAAFALMRHRIRVNLLQPGWMATPAEDEIQKRFHDADDNWLAEAAATQPFGRLIDPEELARSICFLSSPESGMMTGTVIDFDQSIRGAGESPKPTLDPVWGEPG